MGNLDQLGNLKREILANLTMSKQKWEYIILSKFVLFLSNLAEKGKHNTVMIFVLQNCFQFLIDI